MNMDHIKEQAQRFSKLINDDELLSDSAHEHARTQLKISPDHPVEDLPEEYWDLVTEYVVAVIQEILNQQKA